MPVQAYGEKWLEYNPGWRCWKNDKQKITDIITNDGGDQCISKSLVPFLKIQHDRNTNIQNKIVGISGDENIC